MEVMSTLTMPDGVPYEIADAKARAAIKANLSMVPMYEGTPFRRYDLPLNEYNKTYYTDGSTKEVSDYSPVTPCPKYLGWRAETGAKFILYVGTLDAAGAFVLDQNYVINTDKAAVNYMDHTHNRFIETDGDHVFYYRVSAGTVTIVGADVWPEGETSNIAVVPDSVSAKGAHLKNGDTWAIVLPEGCHYAVRVADPPLDASGNPAYLKTGFNVASVTAAGTSQISAGVSFGYIPTGQGAALLTVPVGCPLDALTIYTDQQVQVCTVGGRQGKARELARKLITGFSFKPQKAIQWNDSDLPLKTGKPFHGIPYSSRWINSHFVGYEITPTTLVNALNDPYSIAYDGGTEVLDDGSTQKWEVSKKTEISSEGGPGYGLVCSVFMCLLFGNPYPQSNRGFTFDSNFSMTPLTACLPGMVAVNKGLSHCVMLDELYRNGYALLEAADPCMAQTIHTTALDISGTAPALNSKTRRDFLDDYRYAVANIDESGYGTALLDFDNLEKPGGIVRPWRGHKAVYGPWDKAGKVGSIEGTGIGVTIHGTAAHAASGKVPVKVDFEPFDPATASAGTVLDTTVAYGTRHLDISAAVTKSGTYTVSAGAGTVVEKFRYYEHDAVTLSFDADGTAVFKCGGAVCNDVEYVYVKVAGFGGELNAGRENDDGTMVIAAGKRYPDLAANPGRILTVRAAIVADPAVDSNGKPDCWGKYSCVCTKEE